MHFLSNDDEIRNSIEIREKEEQSILYLMTTVMCQQSTLLDSTYYIPNEFPCTMSVNKGDKKKHAEKKWWHSTYAHRLAQFGFSCPCGKSKRYTSIKRK